MKQTVPLVENFIFFPNEISSGFLGKIRYSVFPSVPKFSSNSMIFLRTTIIQIFS